MERLAKRIRDDSFVSAEIPTHLFDWLANRNVGAVCGDLSVRAVANLKEAYLCVCQLLGRFVSGFDVSKRHLKRASNLRRADCLTAHWDMYVPHPGSSSKGRDSTPRGLLITGSPVV